MKRATLLLIVTMAACSSALAQAGTPGSNKQARITAAAVWQPPADFVTKAHLVCDHGAGPMSFPECFMNQIAAAGAPAEAVAFTRMLYEQSNGDVGIMTAFKPYGPVDAAQVLYPLRANDNYALLLINGDPRVLDVDDLKKLDRTAMEQDAMFHSVKEKYSKMDVWPGDRSGSQPWPRVQQLASGGTRLIVTYPLLNGCHACQRVGLTRFGWDFDANGKFVRTTFIPTPPPPKILPRPADHSRLNRKRHSDSCLGGSAPAGYFA